MAATGVSGISTKKKSVITPRAFGTVGVGKQAALLVPRTSVVTATTASSNAAMRRPFAGSKEVVSATFNKSAKSSGSETTSVGSTISVAGASREAARAAKEKAAEERVAKVAALKQKWSREKKEKLEKNAQQREEDLERLGKLSAAAARARRHALDGKRMALEAKKQEERQELAVKVEDRLHVKKEVEAQERARRRQSTEMRNTMKAKADANQAKMREEADEADRELLESRRLDALEVKEHKMREAEARRQSMAARGEEFQRQRETQSALDQQRRDEEVSLLESRREGREEAKAYMEKERKNRRESLAGRLNVWRQHKTASEEEAMNKRDEEIERLEARRADWMQAEAARKEELHDQRVEISNNLDKWREEKALEAAWKAEDDDKATIERELQAAELDDVRCFKEHLQDQRRQSLAFRIDKHRADAAYEQNQLEIKRQIASEEARLAEQDREDVAKHKEAVIASRRMSLEYRTQRAIQRKHQEEGEKAYQREVMAQDRELSAEAWRDVKRYQEKCRDERRQELAKSLLQQKKAYALDLQKHQQSLIALHRDMEERRHDWVSKKAAKEQDVARRRKSVAMRLDHWRKEKINEAKSKLVASIKAEEEARMREEDREALIKYKRKMKEQEIQDEYTHNFIL